MPRMIVLIDGVIIREVPLTKERTTLGRRPYCDIVIDNLAVSGEHAVLQMEGDEVYLEDLHSTNGTYVNGKSIQRHLLQHGDTIETGKYQIRFVQDAPVPVGVNDSLQASIRVLSGAATGREMVLTKAVNTIGKPGVGTAAISRRSGGFVVHHVEGAGNPALNGVAFGAEPVGLKNGDMIELAGTQMQFIQTG